METITDNQTRPLEPKLRFPEFHDSGGWQKKRFGQVFTRLTTRNIENNQNVLTISGQAGLVSQLDYFNKAIAAKDVRGYFLLHKGDFAYNKSYSQGYPMGAIKRLNKYEKGVVSTLYICFRANREHSESFFEQYFDNGTLNNEIAGIAQEGARNHGLLNIGVNEFFDKVEVIFPGIEEQQKIADCLSSLDELIAAETQKLGALKSYKKGLMQQLFPTEGETVPRLRFPEFSDSGEWDVSTLGENTTKVGSGITPRGGDKTYKKSGRPFIRSQNVGWGKLLLDDVAYIDDEVHATFASTEIKDRDVLLNITGASIGRSAVADLRIARGNVNQHVCIIRISKETLNPFYLNQFILSKYGQNQIDSFQAGGNRQGLNFAQIRSFSIPFPASMEEQIRVAECLTTLDELISVESKKIDVLKAHKKGIMQQLFPVMNEVQE